jgi:hypothetical protein
MRKVVGTLLFLVVAGGVACLNYTSAFAYDHHVVWALDKGVPMPSETIFWGGVAAAVGGGVAWGVLIGGRRER